MGSPFQIFPLEPLLAPRHQLPFCLSSWCFSVSSWHLPFYCGLKALWPSKGSLVHLTNSFAEERRQVLGLLGKNNNGVLETRHSLVFLSQGSHPHSGHLGPARGKSWPLDLRWVSTLLLWLSKRRAKGMSDAGEGAPTREKTCLLCDLRI